MQISNQKRLAKINTKLKIDNIFLNTTSFNINLYVKCNIVHKDLNK